LLEVPVNAAVVIITVFETGVWGKVEVVIEEEEGGLDAGTRLTIVVCLLVELDTIDIVGNFVMFTEGLYLLRRKLVFDDSGVGRVIVGSLIVCEPLRGAADRVGETVFGGGAAVN